MPRPDELLATHLATALPGSLTLNTASVKGNLHHSPVQPGDDFAVFCMLDGGPAPIACNDSNILRKPNVTINIRSKKSGYGDAVDLALAIRDAIHEQTISGFVDVRVRESAPLYVGTNDSGQHEWVMTVEMDETATI